MKIGEEGLRKLTVMMWRGDAAAAAVGDVLELGIMTAVATPSR